MERVCHQETLNLTNLKVYSSGKRSFPREKVWETRRKDEQEAVIYVGKSDTNIDWIKQ